MTPVLQTIIWLGLVAVAVFNPPLAGLGLLTGYAFGDKSFALINAGALLHLPVFVTEPVLAVLLVRALLTARRDGRLPDWEIGPRGPWFWFYAVGVLNVGLGLMSSGPVSVLRDSVIVFYGVAAQITVTYARSPGAPRAVFLAVFLGLAARLTVGLFNPEFGHGSTTFGMYGACLALATIASLPLWGKWKPAGYAVILLFVGLMTSTEVRTVWVGFVLAVIALIVLSRRAGIPLVRLRPGLLAVGASIILTIGLLRVADVEQYRVIRDEFGSMFRGTKTPNLMTRVAMWQDAIQAVVPGVKPLFSKLDEKVVNPYYYGSSKRPEQPVLDRMAREATQYSSKDPSATDILRDFKGKDGTVAEIEPQGRGAKAVRAIVGVPFGERFVPERISAIHQVNRYDPHNSIIAVVYRTGLLGLTFFLVISFGVLWRAFRALRTTKSEELRLLMLSTMTCVAYHIAHSLTDVTLENPFRGIPYWLLLGLLMAFTARAREEGAR